MPKHFTLRLAWRSGQSFFKVSFYFSLLILGILLVVTQAVSVFGAIILGIILPLALWNGIGQALWFKVATPYIRPYTAQNILQSRALMLNIFGLPLVAMLIIITQQASFQHVLAVGFMALTVAAPIGIIAQIAVCDVATWVEQYAEKAKRGAQ